MPLHHLPPRFVLCCLFSLLVYSSSSGQTPPNILVIISDDLGTDVTNGYQQSNLMPTTPNIDNLMANGLTFKNAWSAPICSPTRGAIMSGKFGIKTGMQQVPSNLDPTLHTSVFEELDAQTNGAYANAVIGKWHISSPQDYNHPTQLGVDHYEGVFNGVLPDYYNWNKVTNGVTSTETEYVSAHFTNSAINWINGQTQPWFLWLAHMAPHDPFHVPPAGTYSQNPVNTNRQKYIASIESLDYEIGRLLANIPPSELSNTIIFYLGDNGTPGQVDQNYPNGHAKGSLYQGGVHVPFIVSGAGVTRTNQIENAMINVLDLHATILEVAGATLPGGLHNSLSFDHLLSSPNGVKRPYNYADTEQNVNTAGWTVRDDQYKLINFNSGTQEFYDLLADPLENNNLIASMTPAQTAIKADLEVEGNTIRNNWSCRDFIQNGTETGIDVCTPTTCTGDNSTSTTNIGCCDSPAIQSVYSETVNNDLRYINTNNYPNHDFCYNPNRIPAPIAFEFEMDETPAIAASPTSILQPNFRPDRYFGVAINGVLMAPAPATPFIFENPVTGEFNWDWVFEPTNNQGSGMGKVDLDCSSAHSNGDGMYHYHGNMFEFVETHFGSGISTTTTPPSSPIMVGWASDGFPVLYRFGPDGTGGLGLLQPSFQLKLGDRPGDGISAPCGPFNGKYTNDYEYIAGLGDLDDCNGINRNVTITTLQGSETFNYFYVVTDNFPQISRCMYGTPDNSFDNMNRGVDASLSINCKVFLEGAYQPSTGLMTDDLRAAGSIPLTSPYEGLGYDAASGFTTIATAVLNTTGNKAVVDWILVELRHELDPTSVVFAQAGLLLRDGSIVDTDGVSALEFPYAPAGDYYVALRHRNHLSVLAQNPITFSLNGTSSLDFTVASTSVFGVDPQRDINGVLLLWAGDASPNDAIDASDRSDTWNNRNTMGYLLNDVDLNGLCDAGDRSICWNNRNVVAQLP